MDNEDMDNEDTGLISPRFPKTAAQHIFKIRKLHWFALLLVLSVLLNMHYFFGNETWNVIHLEPAAQSFYVQNENKTDNGVPRKWIVVTSIFPPTEQIRKLSAIPGWQLLVVADLKTPPNWIFYNVILLDIKMQKRLGYDILKFLPWNSYTRKAIGYLYAIEHGAQFIYDTDDDNAPHDPLLFKNYFISENVTRGLVTESSGLVANPYAHFGQPTVWPRGYPLDQISRPLNNTYTTCPMHTPIIQQGIVNGDPDVDAIFRLTRRFMRPNIQFDSRAPPIILPSSVFSPFNSQNTMFHYDAFWSLLLPTTVGFRITDIWRAYWAQPLLWKIGGHVGFYPPHTTQVRNSHVYLKDFGEEEQLYRQSGDLVRFLSTWNCTTTSLYSCMLELTQDMANQKLWASDETDLMLAWISDLKRIGYREPAFKTRSPCLTNETKSLAVFTGVDLSIGENTHRSALREFCNFTAQTNSPKPVFDSQLLIVTFNTQHFKNIWLLDLIYRPHFPNIVYCGEMKNSSTLTELYRSKEFIAAGVKNVSFVRTVNINGGHFHYECALRAIDMHYDVSGYLVVSDDVVHNFWNSGNFSTEEMWIQNNIRYRNLLVSLELQPSISKEPWWKEETNSTINAISMLRNSTNPLVQEFLIRKEGLFGLNSSRLGKTISDLFYIPASKQEMYYAVGDILWKAKVFLEFSTPLLSEGISGQTNTVHLFGTSLFGRDRDNPFNTVFRESFSFFHPVKLSQVMTKPQLRRSYCKKYVARVLGIRVVPTLKTTPKPQFYPMQFRQNYVKTQNNRTVAKPQLIPAQSRQNYAKTQNNRTIIAKPQLIPVQFRQNYAKPQNNPTMTIARPQVIPAQSRQNYAKTQNNPTIAVKPQFYPVQLRQNYAKTQNNRTIARPQVIPAQSRQNQYYTKTQKNLFTNAPRRIPSQSPPKNNNYNIRTNNQIQKQQQPIKTISKYIKKEVQPKQRITTRPTSNPAMTYNNYITSAWIEQLATLQPQSQQDYDTQTSKQLPQLNLTLHYPTTTNLVSIPQPSLN